MRFVYATVATALMCGQSLGYCSEPSFYSSQPSAPGGYDRPDVPYCMSGYSFSREHSCSQWELDNYFSDVEEYVEKLQQFHREAVAFANEAIDYSNSALSYAKCEAEEVATQHE